MRAHTDKGRSGIDKTHQLSQDRDPLIRQGRNPFTDESDRVRMRIEIFPLNFAITRWLIWEGSMRWPPAINSPSVVFEKLG